MEDGWNPTLVVNGRLTTFVGALNFLKKNNSCMKLNKFYGAVEKHLQKYF